MWDVQSSQGFEVPKKSGIYKELQSRWPDLCHDTVVERIIRGREQYLTRNKDRAKREDQGLSGYTGVAWNRSRFSFCPCANKSTSTYSDIIAKGFKAKVVNLLVPGPSRSLRTPTTRPKRSQLQSLKPRVLELIY